MTKLDLPLDAGDFRLMDRVAVDAFLKMPERARFVRAMVAWVGFRQVGVFYDRASREHGQTNYPFKKMLKLAIDAVTAFSLFPLQCATVIGVGSALMSLLGIIWVLYLRFFTDRTVHGWTSLLLVVLFLGGAQLLALGMLGEYIGRTYDETRRRPLYFVSRVVGFVRTK